METIINISEGYKAVLLPKDAEEVSIKRITKDSIMIKYPISDGRLVKEMVRELQGEFEIIGTLDTLTEDQAIDILQFAIMGNWYVHASAVKTVESLLQSFGIQTENPLKKPEKSTYDASTITTDYQEWEKEAFEKDLSAWEASERETKRVIIIKCKEE